MTCPRPIWNLKSSVCLNWLKKEAALEGTTAVLGAVKLCAIARQCACVMHGQRLPLDGESFSVARLGCDDLLFQGDDWSKWRYFLFRKQKNVNICAMRVRKTNARLYGPRPPFLFQKDVLAGWNFVGRTSWLRAVLPSRVVVVLNKQARNWDESSWKHKKEGTPLIFCRSTGELLKQFCSSLTVNLTNNWETAHDLALREFPFPAISRRERRASVA